MEDKSVKDLTEYVPYSKEARSFMAPTKYTVFIRTFIPWQLVKFTCYNFKMLRVLLKGHGRFMDT
ncbi:MAG: hypothetical protein M0Z86_04000 [Deltaproteobacteria bacterium]|nr:hypothetical protein [Deltaproteobacteria bacterium]